ncbi:FISUMP domain-containing protein [Tenacibaculum aiptasiae]|uniref:FISUMP domain-containing protein n=1 Tax=Tenacibaculum aiptasiae TaxID=426481 RepID=UPI003B5C35FD
MTKLYKYNIKLFLYIFLLIVFFNCTNKKQKTTTPHKPKTLIIQNNLTDSRDGETYKTVRIANKIWMAENLRYNSSGSIINPNNPSKTYGRLYNLNSLKDACPKGWHIPSDIEWDELEIAHGMPSSFISKGGWRGEHAIHMRSVEHWNNESNNTNKLKFNVLPAGYFDTGKTGLPKGFEGLGFAAAFWSSTENNIATARFMFSGKTFVNKWKDKNNNTNMALSCRCVKD